jgi:hypothetical protein
VEKDKATSEMDPKTLPDQSPEHIAPPALDTWPKRLALLLDQPFRFAANLTSLGLVSVAVASGVQYSSWRDEKNLVRHQEELSHAISNFSEISGTLSAVVNLQQMLYFTYKGALGDVDETEKQYLSKAGKAIVLDYTVLRTALRKSVDVLTAKADLFIDRPTRSDSQRVVSNSADQEPQVFSNRDMWRNNGMDCKKHLPQKELITVGKLTVDWTQTRTHVAMFYYCLEEVHLSIYQIRVWASQIAGDDAPSTMPPDNKSKAESRADTLSEHTMKEIEDAFILETRRLNEFITLATLKIEQIRLRAKENGFFRHPFCFFCS